MKAATAMQVYLNDRDGGPVDVKKAAEDLKLGGAEPGWQDDRYERNVRIMLSNNLKLFKYDKGSDVVELVKQPRYSSQT